MQKIALLSVGLICMLATCGSCKKSDSTAPITPSSLDFSAIDTLLQDSVPLKFGGNAYVLITVDGLPAYSKGFGSYTANTKMLIASCSKWLSGGLIMKLVDEGTLRLTDTVGRYLPVFTKHGKGALTISQLFSHTSGFPGDSPQGYENNSNLTLAQAVDSIATNVALINNPGTEFYYGGVGMQVAGRIAELAAGKSWDSLFNEKIAIPCGMTNTDFGLTPNPIIAGGVRSTVTDYSNYLIMLMNKGVTKTGVRVLSEAAINAMETSQIGTAAVQYSPYPLSLLNTTAFYGVGNWRDLTAPGNVLLENSSPGKFGSHPWIDRNKKMTGMLFTYIPVNGYLITMGTALNMRSLARGIVPDH
jgi:CubicO group peptidase (beta-lactamase class C family)